MNAITFDAIDGSSEEHHHSTSDGAELHYTSLLERRRPGILTLWLWDQAAEAWQFVKGDIQLFENKPSTVQQLGPIDGLGMPLAPLDLEELSARGSGMLNHFAPDH